MKTNDVLLVGGLALAAFLLTKKPEEASPAEKSGLVPSGSGMTNADAINAAIADSQEQLQKRTINDKGRILYADQYSPTMTQQLAVAEIMAQNTNLINATNIDAARTSAGAVAAAQTGKNVLVSVNPNLTTATTAAAISRSTTSAPAGSVVQTTSTSKAIATGQAGVVRWVKK